MNAHAPQGTTDAEGSVNKLFAAPAASPRDEMIDRAARHHSMARYYQRRADGGGYLGKYDEEEAYYHLSHRNYWLAEAGVTEIRPQSDDPAKVDAFFASLPVEEG